MRSSLFTMGCLCQLLCVLSVSALPATADVNGMAVGFPVVETDPATTALVPRANMRYRGANSGLAVATVTGSFALAVAICSAGTGPACITVGILAVIQGWAATFLVGSDTSSNNPTGNSVRSLPHPQYDHTVAVGGGATHMDEVLAGLVHPEHFAQEWYQEILQDMRNKEPHYMTLKADGKGSASAKWFINETSHPGINDIKKRDGTVVTEIYYTWDNENQDRYNEYDKRSPAMNQEADEVARFTSNNFENKFCLGFDDDDQSNPKVNNGELYFNQEGGIDSDCNADNQGVFRMRM